MKMTPLTKHGWLRLLSLPFKAYVIGTPFIYAYWFPKMPEILTGRGRGDYATTQWVTNLFWGYFVSFVALVVLARLQAVTKNSKETKWNLMFAGMALISGGYLAMWRGIPF